MRKKRIHKYKPTNGKYQSIRLIKQHTDNEIANYQMLETIREYCDVYAWSPGSGIILCEMV